MSDSARIIITGDTHLGGGRVRSLAANNNAEALFGDFLPLIKKAGLSITNLESPILNDGNPILKTGPNMKSPVETLPVLKTAGFDLVTLANNHMMDYGEEGLFSTLKACKENDIKTVGAGKNLEEAKKPFICEINGIRLAIVNIAENEFGTTQNHSPGGHPLNPVQNFYTLQEAKAIADKVIVIVHGGHEHYELPSPRMKETYRFFADAGADAVVGHHTHCYSGYEVYNNVPIFYSTGNFLFDKENQGAKVTPWNEGIILELACRKNSVEFEFYPFIQNDGSTGLRPMDNEEKSVFQRTLQRLNSIIEDDTELSRHFDDYCKRSNRLYSAYLEPHSVKVLHYLRNRSLFPSLLSKRKRKLLLNLTRCEAHRDILTQTLES